MSQSFLRVLAWCLALMLMVAGCVLKPLPGALPGTGIPQDGVSQTIPLITGQLIDGSGQPVEGAAVRAYVAPYRIEGMSTAPVTSVETVTDAQGSFTLVSPPLGSVAVEARGQGQKALRTGVKVASGATVELGTIALQPTGRIAGRVTVASGASLLGTDVFIPGTDYLAKTSSDGHFVIQEVPVGSYQLAVVRQSFQPRVLEGVQVLAGQTTEAPDLELSLDAPVLQGLNPESGGPGTVVTLRGENFGESKHSSLQVTFNDTLATTVRRLSDTEIQATVPMEATSGGVVVRSNGIASAGRAFQVVARLSLAPNNVGLFPGTTYAFSLQAHNERGEVVADPFVTWALRDPALGTVSAQGVFEGHGEGASEVQVRSGLLSATAWVGVSRYKASTPYGTGMSLSSGDGGWARDAAFEMPFGLAKDALGNVYVAQGNLAVIRRISPEGIVERFAGNGRDDSGGDGGLATDAGLGDGVGMSYGGNRLWISDVTHHVIRFIPLDDRAAPALRAGYIYRAAGIGKAGYSGSGLEGDLTALNQPAGLCAGPDGMYFADTLNCRIRRITADLKVVDVLGSGASLPLTVPAHERDAAIDRPGRMAFDAKGNVMIGCRDQLLFWCRTAGIYFGRSMEAGQVYPLAKVDATQAFQGDGALGKVVLNGIYPGGLCFDDDGYCWFTDATLVRRITPQGRIETVAGKPLEASLRRIFGFDGEGANALATSIGSPSDLLMMGSQALVADSLYNRIRRLSLPGL